MPKYDFAHPQFNKGFVTFPVKQEPLFEKFCNLARRYRINVIRSQMIVTTTDYTAKVFNRLSYIEIKHDMKSTILHNETEMENYFRSLKCN